jgi:DNA-nicking Smr family endonuclease
MNKDPKDEVSLADKELFHDAMEQLQQTSTRPPQDSQITQANLARLDTSNLEQIYIEPVAPEQQLSFTRSGISDKRMQKLRKGDLYTNASIDLHGLTIQQTGAALAQFIPSAQNNHTECILIVHGKGSTEHYPILKSFLNAWLPTLEQALAYCSALPRDGGAGAIYVLLKKS